MAKSLTTDPNAEIPVSGGATAAPNTSRYQGRTLVLKLEEAMLPAKAWTSVQKIDMNKKTHDVRKSPLCWLTSQVKKG